MHFGLIIYEGMMIPTPVDTGNQLNVPRHAGIPALWKAVFSLLALVVLAAILRFYRLSEQAIWMDEYFSVVNLSAPNLLHYLWLVQCNFPEQMVSPLYYILQYGWAQWIGMNETTLRVLPVLISLSAVPMIALLGSYLAGFRAGWLSALCLALSAQHIWFAQEPRPYSLLTPLALLSVYALLRWVREKHPAWLALNLIANMLLVWSHPFAGLVLMVEGVFLLLCARRYFRAMVAWGALHTLFLIPWIVRLLMVPYFNEIDSDISLLEIFQDLFLSDVLAFHPDLLPAWKTNPLEELPQRLQALLTVRGILDAALTLVLLAGAVACLSGLIPALRRRMYPALLPEQHSTVRENHLMLCLLLVLPVLTLGLMTLVLKKPFSGPMYTIYCTASIYIGLGMVWMRVSRSAPRAIFAGGVAMLFIYQAVIFLPFPTRTNWRAAADHIRSEGSPGDLVLNLLSFFPGELLHIYMDDHPIDIRRVPTLELACTLAHAYYAESDREEAEAVWFVHSRYEYERLSPHFSIRETLEQALEERGLCIEEVRQFSGHYNIRVYRIRPEAETRVARPLLPVPTFFPIDFQQVLSDLGVDEQDTQLREELLPAAQRVISAWPPYAKLFLLLACQDSMAAGDLRMAELLARYIVAQQPKFGMGHYLLGLVLVAMDRDEEAEAAFRRGYDLHKGLGRIMRPFTDSLLTGHAFPHAELDRIESMGYLLYGHHLRKIAEQRFPEIQTAEEPVPL